MLLSYCKQVTGSIPGFVLQVFCVCVFLRFSPTVDEDELVYSDYMSVIGSDSLCVWLCDWLAVINLAWLA